MNVKIINHRFRVFWTVSRSISPIYIDFLPFTPIPPPTLMVRVGQARPLPSPRRGKKRHMYMVYIYQIQFHATIIDDFIILLVCLESPFIATTTI